MTGNMIRYDREIGQKKLETRETWRRDNKLSPKKKKPSVTKSPAKPKKSLENPSPVKTKIKKQKQEVDSLEDVTVIPIDNSPRELTAVPMFSLPPDPQNPTLYYQSYQHPRVPTTTFQQHNDYNHTAHMSMNQTAQPTYQNYLPNPVSQQGQTYLTNLQYEPLQQQHFH